MTNEQRSLQNSQAATVSQSRQAESSTSRQMLPLSWIERIFQRLSAFYGSRFADMWRGCDIESVKSIWAQELSGFTKEELAAGIAACRNLEWPPTLPTFMKLCRQPLDYERAFMEAVEQMRKRETGEDRWSKPAIYWAAVKIGNDLHAYSYASLKGRWHAALDEAIDGIRNGKLSTEIPIRRDALPPPGQRTTPPEIARQRLAEIRQKLAEKLAA
jgi:hypothetical protein